MLSHVPMGTLYTWLVALSLLALAGFATSRWIIPYILRRLVSNFRVRSISARSIRGLFLKRGNVTVNLERIGISFHSPTDSSARHIHVQVQGLIIHVTDLDASSPSRATPDSRTESRSTYPFDIAPPLAMMAGLLPSWFLWVVDAVMRPILRWLFVGAARGFIRLLPSLSQIVDIQLDSMTIVFEDLGDAYINIRGVTLATKVAFSQLADTNTRSVEEAKVAEKILEEKAVSRAAAGWGNKLALSSQRTWKRAWSVTQGSTSISLKLRGITVSDDPWQHGPSERTRTVSSSSAHHSAPQTPSAMFFASAPHEVINDEPPPGVAFAIASPTLFHLSADFTTTAFKEESLRTNLDVSEVFVSSQTFNSIWTKIVALRASRQRNEAAADAAHIKPWIIKNLKARALRQKSSQATNAETDVPKPMNSQNAVHRRIQSFMRILLSAELRLSSLTILHKITQDDIEQPAAFTLKCEIQGFFIKVKQSRPEDNEMHRKWLGKPSQLRPKLDAQVLSLSIGMSILTVSRTGSSPATEKHSLLIVGESGIDMAATQIPGAFLTPASCLGADPNASVSIIETRVRRVRISEQLDMLHESLELFPQHRQNKLLPRPRSTPKYRRIPAIILDSQFSDIRLRLWHDDHANPPVPERFYIEYATDYFGLMLSSSFVEPSFRVRTGHSTAVVNAAPLKLELHGTAHITPSTIRLEIVGDDQGDNDYIDDMLDDSMSADSFAGLRARSPSLSAPSLGIAEPLYSYTIARLDAIEISLQGQALAIEVSAGDTYFTRDNTLVELKLRMECFLLDLRDLRVAASLSSLCDILHTLRKHAEGVKQQTRPGKQALSSKLPAGLSAHVWVGGVHVAIAGPDVNPNAPPDFSRGLAMSSSLVFEYCCLISPQRALISQRDRPTFGAVSAAAREKLSLDPTMYEQASAFAQESLGDGTKSALFRLTARDTKVWVISTSCARSADFPRIEDEVRSSAGFKHRLDNRIVLEVPQLHTRGFLARRNDPTTEGLPRDRLNLSFEVPRLYWRFHILHAYCFLLVNSRVRRFLRTPGTASGIEVAANPPVGWLSAQIRIDDMQGMVVLTSKEKLYLRSTRLKLDYSASETTLRGDDIMAWVPCVRPESNGSWEELGRIIGWNISVTVPLVSPIAISDLVLSIHLSAMRLRVPHDYVLSELIQDISVAYKAIRHLHHRVAAGSHQDIGPPIAEPPKHLPSVIIKADYLSLELEDDPLDAQMNLNWRIGLEEQQARTERAAAFDAKVTAIRNAEAGRSTLTSTSGGSDWKFDSHHSVDTDEAWQRLQQFTSQSWVKKVRSAIGEQERRETVFLAPMKRAASRVPLWTMIDVRPIAKRAPLLRAHFRETEILFTPPRFDYEQGLQTFMSSVGSGLPSSTTFDLLAPTHICWVAKALRISIRDYPLPLFNVPAHNDLSHHAWVFDTDLVIAEELGPPSSITWTPCIVTHAEVDVTEYELLVPKAIMPMKTYAEPTIEVNSSSPTDFSWGVSLMPAIADVTRAMDRVTTPTRDPSPPIGFWDKLRLAVHWRLKASFSNDVHIHLKGSRDPHILSGQGVGFALEWKGHPKFTIGHSPEDKELMQLGSKRMYLTIPDLRRFDPLNRIGNDSENEDSNPFNADHLSRSRHGKIVAKFEDEVRMGLGFAFEGAALTGDRLHGHLSSTRVFHFKPHFQVALRSPHETEAGDDSFAGFRSRHIHLSVSLRSIRGGPGAQNGVGSSHANGANRFYLSPRTFAHFWSWWGLFNHALSLPIRHGPLFPGIKELSPKFSDNLATIKYQVVLEPVFVAHIYHQDSRAGWKEGSTTCVGIKVQIEALQADLHQREQFMTEYDPKSRRTKTTVHRRFHSAEVVLKSSEIRAVRTLFMEPQKALFSTSTEYDEPDAPGLPDCDVEPHDSEWLDFGDFVDVDWTPSDAEPRIWLIPCGFIPRFTYLKRVPPPDSSSSKASIFGDENTHNCLQGREDSVQSIQRQFAENRLAVLRDELYNSHGVRSDEDGVLHDPDHRDEELQKRISLLEEYINQFNLVHRQDEETRKLAEKADPTLTQQSYYMAQHENPGSDHWDAFHNVYQIHCPKIILSNTTRDILLDYYYSSRHTRGLEYQMATRAVQFIREQAMRAKPAERVIGAKKARNAATRVAGKALRKIIPGDQASNEKPPASQKVHHQNADTRWKEDARSGLSEEAVVKNGHFMLLLKPQVALRSENGLANDLVAVANTVSLHNYVIMDPNHLDDPVHGVVMHRNFIKLNRLQVFAANQKIATAVDKPHDVPLEILVDYRCKHGGFTRLLPQADAKIHFDKFNRLRLRGESTTNLATGVGDMSDHLRTQTDRITVNIPRFSVAANSANFAAIYNVITDLLLYHDPAQQQHNEALEKFVYLFDFRDRHSAAEVVTKMQHRIGQLRRVASNYDLDVHRLSDDEKLELLAIKSQLFMLSRELNLIFESIARAQARQADMEGNDVFAVRLDAISSDLSWNALDERNMLLSKLSIRDTQYTWISRNDGSMSNSLTIGDMQALDASPNAVFPEMLVKLQLPGEHDGAFMQADWSALPAVGGISIIETFDLQLHPLRLQIERSIGRRVMKYIFSGGVETSAAPIHNESGDQNLKEPPLSRPRASMDSTPTSSTLQRPHTIARSSSFQNLRSSGASLPPLPRKKVPSSDQLDSRAEDLRGPRGTNKAVDMEIEEMRARASRNRTFLQIQVSSLICVLSYKRDTPLTLTTVPDLDNFQFRTPKFEYHNQIWSFEEAVHAMKRDFYREVWRQKGVLIRELAVKAKFITPRKFLLSASEHTSNISRPATPPGDGRPVRKRWPHIFRHRPNTPPTPPLRIPEPRSRFVNGEEPLVSSPSSDSYPSSGNTEYGNSSRQNSSLSPPARTST